ncbi:P-loop containing nucleoside triphosphate hydrolase protein [Cercophora newfieldiana]|uniref:P-loop containing nucleoside triphosphate hydrolase protein n=1 Tax=Cercophora newfieldiana TaxID=92897 RepID=A0AA39YHW5_9PEZI|nr:P-loop containing nucleoside triphosphate hydrolase protein [Cercophora newfieldiana]
MDPKKAKKDSKVVIALLGVTGAGKSTFVNTACGRDVSKISHSSKPCTQVPQAVEFGIGDRTIVLIDTPGFDDDKRSDVRILEDIATWMAKKGYREQMLDGLIFLHPITHTRAGGSELNRTQLLEKILGEAAYSRVVIATTMWDYIVSEDLVKDRLDSRCAPGGVWHELISKGALTAKHYNTPESAHSIINTIVEIADRLGKPQSLLETELKQQNGRVVHTSAGKSLEVLIKRDIGIFQNQVQQHLDYRPPGSYRNDGVREHKMAWKRWNREHQALQAQLAEKEEELKKLQGIVVRFFNAFTALFRSR